MIETTEGLRIGTAKLKTFVLIGALALGLAGCGQKAPSQPQTGYQEPSLEQLVRQEPAPPEAVTAEPEPLPIETTVISGAALDGSVRVGLLLPLSGRHAAIGRALLNAAQLALFDVADEDFKLLIADSGGTVEGARAAARDLVDRGAGLILGPLFSTAVAPVAEEAASYGVPIVAFSNNASVAQPSIYIMGVLPEIQVERIIAFAHSQDLWNVAALVPNTDYGNVVTQAFQEASLRSGVEIADIKFFDPLGEDAEAAARALADYERRNKELLDERELLEARGDEASLLALKRLEILDTLNPPDYQAVFLPLGGRQLLTAAPLLAYYDVDPADVRYLGTALWDDESLTKEPTLLGGWFAAPDPQYWDAFLVRYRELYDEEPPRLASLGYDATALAAVLARGRGGEQSGQPIFSSAALTNPNGFSGVDGIFRFLPDGRVQRALAILEIERDGFAVIDPAPTTFEVEYF